MKKVALILDHPSRDLDYISDIALSISESGIKTYIVPSNMRHRELLLLRPDYVLYTNHRDTSANEIRILNEVGVSIGVLETEQCVTDAFFEKSLKRMVVIFMKFVGHLGLRQWSLDGVFLHAF